MEVFLVVLFFIIGLLLILKGGDYLVDSAIWIAKVTGIPEMVIGATIVSIATTLPEVMVSTIATVKGVISGNAEQLTELAGLAVGNAVGSMMSNICLSLAIVLMAQKMITSGKSFKIKAIYLIGVTVAICLLTMGDSMIKWYEGVFLLLAFVGFMAINVIEAIKNKELPVMEAEDNVSVSDESEKILSAPAEVVKKQNPVAMISMFFVGALCIGFGAWLLVTNGEKLALFMGIPAQVVGITIVAIGTGLPEMITSIKSVKKKKGNLGMGNIIGANIINSTLLLGLISVISGQGLAIDAITKNVGLVVLLAITLILTIPAIINKRTYKWQGISMMAIYVVFLVFNVVSAVI